MTYRTYRNTDVGAPQLLGQRDGFNTVLKAILVDGYGAMPAAGWTSPYSSAGIRVYKQGTGGNARYLRVWDGQTVVDPSYGWNLAMAGYEAMTAVSTGTARWPTTAQQSGNGLMARYRNGAVYDAGAGEVPLPWTCKASSNFFIFFINAYGQPEEVFGDSASSVVFFGSFASEKSGDTYGDIIAAGASISDNGFNGGLGEFGKAYVTRSHTFTGGSIPAALVVTSARPGQSNFGNGTTAYPDAIKNSLMLDKVGIHTSATNDLSLSAFRGVLPGVFSHPHPLASLPANTVFSGNGVSAARQFQVKSMSGNSQRLVVELSDTWE